MIFYTNQSSKILQNPLVFIEVGEHCSVSIVEETIGEENLEYGSNVFKKIHIKENAQFFHYPILHSSSLSTCLSHSHVVLEKDSLYSCYQYTVSSGFSRNMISAFLEGEGSHCDLFGVHGLSDYSCVEDHLLVEHRVPNSSSNQYYRYLLEGFAKGSFCGIIRILKDSQNIRSKQYNHAILLGESAQMYTQPQLDIFAHQVESAHGATVGYLNKEALFYLKSRGLSSKDARRLLVEGAIAEVLQSCPLESLVDPIQKKLLHSIHLS